MNAKLVVSTIVSVLALTSCGSSKGEAELDSTQSKQELAWGHVVEACKLNLGYVQYFGTEAALNEIKKAAKLDPNYFEYIEAHLFITSYAKSGVGDFDEAMLQGSKIDALCLAANEG
jgi:Tfp pilus assembly protein PilF